MGTARRSPDDVISTAEAATILGRSARQVRQHAENGSLPGHKLNARTWVFRRGDVEAAVGNLPRPGRRWAPAPEGETPAPPARKPRTRKPKAG